MSLMSAKRSQQVISQFVRSPSNSTMNSSTSPRWSRYFSRRCCLQMSAVCFCRFLVPNPICAPNFCTGSTAAHYARDFLLLNLATISSAVSSPILIFSTTVLNAKPSLGSDSIKRLRSAIGPRGSYCLSSSGDTSRTLTSFVKIASEGNRHPSSMSERKGAEMPIWSANLRKDKSALSRNS
jgi:hypothetical protein